MVDIFICSYPQVSKIWDLERAVFAERLQFQEHEGRVIKKTLVSPKDFKPPSLTKLRLEAFPTSKRKVSRGPSKQGNRRFMCDLRSVYYWERLSVWNKFLIMFSTKLLFKTWAQCEKGKSCGKWPFSSLGEWPLSLILSH